MSDEVETQEEEPVEEVKPIAGIGTLVFGKYDAAEVVCRDPGLAPYINLSTVGVPHTGGRHANAWFGKARLSVVERFTNKLMRTGKYTGKKMGALKAFEAALDSMAAKREKTPLQAFVDAICRGNFQWKRLPVSSSVRFLSQKQLTVHLHEGLMSL